MIQIDAKKIIPGSPGNLDLIECNLYTGERCVKIFIASNDYENLIRDKFFIRDGKTTDSAGCINTTDVYVKKGGSDEA